MATSSKVKRRWNDENYDKIYLSVPKGQKEMIREFAIEQGLSLNKYIQIAIIDKVAKDCEQIDKGKIT